MKLATRRKVGNAIFQIGLLASTCLGMVAIYYSGVFVYYLLSGLL